MLSYTIVLINGDNGCRRKAMVLIYIHQVNRVNSYSVVPWLQHQQHPVNIIITTIIITSNRRYCNTSRLSVRWLVCSLRYFAQWQVMTLKGKGQDSSTFGAHCLKNSWRYRLGYNAAPTGNGTWCIKWSRNPWRHVTLKGKGRVFWMQISRKPLEAKDQFQRTTDKKWPMVNRMVMWLKFKMLACRRSALSGRFSSHHYYYLLLSSLL